MENITFGRPVPIENGGYDVHTVPALVDGKKVADAKCGTDSRGEKQCELLNVVGELPAKLRKNIRRLAKRTLDKKISR